jgi:tol-pal system protein YbgF
MRWLFIISLVLLPFSFASAQTRAETLADIRQELNILFVEVQRLRGELNTTEGGISNSGQGGLIDRLELIEAELRGLTGQTERLEFRINRIVKDGTNRIGDLEFRLCELEENCDIGQLGISTTLGGDADQIIPPIVDNIVVGSGDELAIGETSDFDAAKDALNAGDYADASDRLARFIDAYPGGALTTDAHFYRGQSLAGMDAWSKAARSFLNAFSGAPDGNLAPDALYMLGVSLAKIGQTDEACLTLNEVELRYPDASATQTALAEMQVLGCS